ncbi:MAG: hypothetical protein ACRD17_01930 [Terriglobales bacterium]
MDTSQILLTIAVNAGGIAAIAWVNWYFLLAPERRPRAGSRHG